MSALDAVFSFCITCHSRTYDLKKTMPSIIEAANTSPPIEIVVLDYNSSDLGLYMTDMMQTEFVGGSHFTYRKYIGRDYYHMAHAINLSVLAASGEYIVIWCCDMIPKPSFIPTLRHMIDEQDLVWVYGPSFSGAATAIRRSEFIESGGCDERFEFYGPIEKDLYFRLRNRGLKSGRFPDGLLDIIYTPDKEKQNGYRLGLPKREMAHLMYPIFLENCAKGVMVANQGVEWGSWK